MYTEIYLGKEVLKQNEFFEKEKALEYSSTSFFCLEKSVKHTEFYQAMQNGMKVEKIIDMNVYEYKEFMQNANHRVCKVIDSFTGIETEYTIVREYELNSDNIELTLVRGVELGNA